MYPTERHRAIVEIARQRGRVEVVELAGGLEVAPETIRRDLAELERRGLLRRVHGGALPLEGLGFEGSLLTREERFADEKRRIAHAALPLALDADSIFLDEGSSGSALAAILRPERELTVVTASLPIALELSTHENVVVLCLGGRVRTRTLAVVEHWTISMLSELVIDLAFIGTNSITARRGLSCPDTAVAAVKAQAIRSARRSVLLADHSKFGSDSFAVFAAITDFSFVITDGATSKTDVDSVTRRGVQVIRA